MLHTFFLSVSIRCHSPLSLLLNSAVPYLRPTRLCVISKFTAGVGHIVLCCIISEKHGSHPLFTGQNICLLPQDTNPIHSRSLAKLDISTVRGLFLVPLFDGIALN